MKKNSNYSYLIDIIYDKKKYLIKIKTESANELSFIAKVRETESVIQLTSSKISNNDNNSVYSVTINKSDVACLPDNAIVDIFTLDSDGKEGKIIVKRKGYDLRLLAMRLTADQVFYPYHNAHGHLSFRRNDVNLFSFIESANVRDNILTLKGYGLYPDQKLYSRKITCSKIKIEDDKYKLSYSVPIKLEKNLDFKQSEVDSDIFLFNFVVKINLTLLELLEKQKYKFKFYLELTYESNGDFETIESLRVRYLGSIFKANDKGMQYVFNKTNKSDYLSMIIDTNTFWGRVWNKAKSKLAKARRSKTMLKLYRSIFRILGKIPISNKVVIFESFHGKQYSDNPRAIYEYMKENLDEYKLYWSADRRNLHKFQGRDLNVVRRFSVKWLLLMATAKLWVTNARLPLWIPKPSKTLYLQTWHGTPLKRLATDMDKVLMPGTNTEKYKRNFTRESSNWDFLVSPNIYSTEIFKRAFDFNKQVIESGYPRNDYLINSNNRDEINKIKVKLGIPKDKKVILYAPTWRDNQFYGKGKYKFDIQLDLNKLQERFGGKYVILLRMHYLIAENLDLSGFEGFVFDESHYEDIRELYLVSDILITDYSSVFFDYANLKRPIIFFVYDIEEYRDNLRGFYIDFENKAPGPLVVSTEQIIDEISKIEENGFIWTPELEDFHQKFCSLENGKASEKVVTEVIKKF